MEPTISQLAEDAIDKQTEAMFTMLPKLRGAAVSECMIKRVVDSAQDAVRVFHDAFHHGIENAPNSQSRIELLWQKVECIEDGLVQRLYFRNHMFLQVASRYAESADIKLIKVQPDFFRED